jgi:hypothetical protein
VARLVVAVILGTLTVAPAAQIERLPVARLVPAPPLTLPGIIDSNIPMVWELVDGTWRLFAFTSWGGRPSLLTGPALDQLRAGDTVALVPDPGDGVWIQSVVADEGGTWYGYYHHERPADVCGRPDRFILRLGAARSRDHGRTWEDLGIILEAAPETLACVSPNLYVIGGVGDVSAMLTPDRTDLFLFFSQYSKNPAEQGVTVARLAWADRDAPVGRVTVWVDGAWMPPRHTSSTDADAGSVWAYPAGTPLAEASRPWHDAATDADAFWGPSVHWNRHLERYVMLLNRARDEDFNNEGIYVSYARTLRDPRVWTTPRRILTGGVWYPQVAGLEPITGTDKDASQRARFFLQGHSAHYIEFQR